ncbi:26S proteasome subunit RPN7-domain-containing protein [Rhodotorula diobovata]|uniref:26S proteasome subunit RPN7-domain-containing protein n=1 Tax=Rhodotorula diobovata TaxID=5288 RepID=A0A5C5FL85_9BASI|nr:26S proteasome subunit RPN7-domain-containing protein [Rhodotorula diobovata]
MDIDPAQPVPHPARRIVVRDDTPLDLDQLAATWDGSGRNKITRLLFVASASPSLAGPALTLALGAIKEATLDTKLYEDTFYAYRKHLRALEAGDEQDPLALSWFESVKGHEEQVDREWLEAARKEAQTGLDRLEIELKGYMTNLIKESIRMGYRDLARFQYRTGDLPGAVRSYTKSREFCTTSNHVLEMCLGVIEVALDMANYAFVRNYVVKAESALEGAQAASSGGKSKAAPVNLPGMVAPAQDPIEAAKERERKSVHERLTVAGGVGHLGSSAYNKAAHAFTDIGSEALVSGPGHFIPPADIALYATLTSLACFTRSALKTRVLENPGLRPFLDLEPYLRDIVRAFYDSRFKVGLELLHKHEARFHLDMHLAQHVDPLLRAIKERALLAYFTPFASVSLSRMSSAFGWPEDVMQGAVVDLIQRGQMKARIDQAKGVVVARRTEPRVEAFRNALEQGEKMQRKAAATQLRYVGRPLLFPGAVSAGHGSAD